MEKTRNGIVIREKRLNYPLIKEKIKELAKMS